MAMYRPISRLVLLLAALCLLSPLGCGSSDPFSYAKVSGKVTYDDGSPIPADVTLTFYPQTPAKDPKTFPRAGTAMVDKATGALTNITSRKANDGLVRGKHKVTVTDSLRKPLPSNVVPPEYADLQTTPLEVDTAQQPFELKVRKPGAK